MKRSPQAPGEDDFIYLLNDPDRVACEHQEEDTKLVSLWNLCTITFRGRSKKVFMYGQKQTNECMLTQTIQLCD